MSADASFIIALAITLSASLAAARFLWRYLDPVFADYCGNAPRGRLWSIFCLALLVLLPLLALALDLDWEGPARSWLFAVMARLRWPLSAMVVAMMIIIAIAAMLHIPRDLPLTRTEIDDLKRLLDRVQTLRAKELLAHLEATPAINPKELAELNRLVDKIQEVRPSGRRGHVDDPDSVN